MISRLSYCLSFSFELKVHLVIIFGAWRSCNPYLVDFSALLRFLSFWLAENQFLQH